MVNANPIERPFLLARIIGYFVIWVFTAAVLGVISDKLYATSGTLTVCAYGKDAYCQWGIAASVIGFVSYLALNALVLTYVFVDLSDALVKIIELVSNAFFFVWYIAFAIVMSVGVSKIAVTPPSSANAPPALSWISLVIIIGMFVCVMLDSWEEKSDGFIGGRAATSDRGDEEAAQ